MQIDFILFMHKLVTDVKVIPGEEVALQHQLLVCDMRIDVPPKSKCKVTPRLKVWKLKDYQTSNHFQEVFNLHVSTSAGVADATTEDIWNIIKTGLLKTIEMVCGTTQSHHWCRETWWWNEHMEKATAVKRKAFKAWKTGKGTRAPYFFFFFPLPLLTMTNPNQLCEMLLFVCSKKGDETNLSSKLPVTDRTREV